MDEYPWVGTRCKKGYKVNKKLKRCISKKISKITQPIIIIRRVEGFPTSNLKQIQVA
jgi:hypothetical protein